MQSPYKGGTKNWGWRLFFNNTTAMTGAVFTALSTAIGADLANVLPTTSTIISAVGYDAGSDVPTNSRTMSVAGGFSPSSGEHYAPLEVAALMRFTTTQRTSKNHPIYLFKYMRAVILAATGNPEVVPSGRRTTYTSLATDLVNGFATGGVTYKLAGPYGAVAQSGACEQYFTHRDFPR